VVPAPAGIRAWRPLFHEGGGSDEIVVRALPGAAVKVSTGHRGRQGGWGLAFSRGARGGPARRACPPSTATHGRPRSGALEPAWWRGVVAASKFGKHFLPDTRGVVAIDAPGDGCGPAGWATRRTALKGAVEFGAWHVHDSGPASAARLVELSRALLRAMTVRRNGVRVTLPGSPPQEELAGWDGNPSGAEAVGQGAASPCAG